MSTGKNGSIILCHNIDGNLKTTDPLDLQLQEEFNYASWNWLYMEYFTVSGPRYSYTVSVQCYLDPHTLRTVCVVTLKIDPLNLTSQLIHVGSS